MTPEQVEQHRLECEARHVLAMPRDERKPWLNSIGAKRGPEAQAYLEEEVMRQHKLMKEGA